MAASQLIDAAATTGGLASGRRRYTTAACPFLQCSMPSLQWPEMRTATLMNKEGGPAVLLSSDWFARQVRSPEAHSLARGGFAFQNLFLFLAHLGRRLMRILHRLRVAAALFGAALMVTAAQAATFSGSSADITDFAGGSEVSTSGTLIDAVKVLNHNDRRCGRQHHDQRRVVQGHSARPVPRRRRVVCERLVRLSRRRRLCRQRFVDLRWGLRHAG